jgi:hypothetical protein
MVLIANIAGYFLHGGYSDLRTLDLFYEELGRLYPATWVLIYP